MRETLACFPTCEKDSKLAPSKSLEKMTPEDLNATLALFIHETRKVKNGSVLNLVLCLFYQNYAYVLN